MKRAVVVVSAVSAAAAALPASAYAVEAIPAAAFYPHIGVSLIGLAVALVLLVEAVGVRKIAFGGAIAEKISYVILAILCLSASALTEWAVNFTNGVTIAQAQLAREVLVILAMALLAAYFYSVRKAMQVYLRSMTDDRSSASGAAQEEKTDNG